MRKLLLICLIVFTTPIWNGLQAYGFGGSKPVPAKYIGAPEFGPWLDRFILDGQDRGVKGLKTSNLRIQWSEMPAYPAYVIGLCESGCAECPRVSLRKSWWNRQSDAQKKLLMHHELGHCLLQRPHRTDFLGNGNPASVMYPSILPDSIFNPSKSYYLSELYTHATTTEDRPQTFVCEEGELK